MKPKDCCSDKEHSLDSNQSVVSGVINLLILQESPLETETILSVLHKAEYTLSWQGVATRTDYLTHLNPSIDLILADGNLGEFNVIEALLLLQEQGLNIPFIVVNGNVNASVAVDCMKAGATDYLLRDQLRQLPLSVKRSLLSQPQRFLAQPTKTECDFLKVDLEQRLSEQTAEVARLTEQSQWAMAQRGAAEKALLESEAQLQMIISELADGVLVVDKGGIVRFVNPAVLSLLERKPEDLLGQVLGFPVINGDNTEVDIPRNNTETAIAQMRVVEIQWKGKKAYLVSLRDITKSKQAEEERIQLLKKAQAANRIKDEFLAVVSHELRTPLNPILGWSKLLLTRKLTPAKSEMALETIERNASLQAQLIDDLLDISRILRGKLELKACPVDLATPIAAAIETVSLAATAKSIKIETVKEGNRGLVSGDANRLQQIIWNLLSNAIKFTPPKGRIEVRLKSLESEVQLQVSDTGKGIKPDFLPHVFEHFRQEDSTTTRNVGGLGLGLAIVHYLVELHGGTIEVESPGEGKGTTFTIKLPLISSSQSTNSTPQQTNDNPDLSNLKVLVVEDEANSRDLLTFILEDYGANVRAFSSAKEALLSFAQTQPDLLVSDIAMPEMDGYMLIRQIRSLPPEQGGKIPAIALTAYARESDRQQAMESGFTFYLPKPLEPTLLVEMIANLV
ncbi:MAG: response regulator [Coleofasciculaceae cyanobacterium]